MRDGYGEMKSWDQFNVSAEEDRICIVDDFYGKSIAGVFKPLQTEFIKSLRG